MRAFFRSLREATGGKPFPYMLVPEWYKAGHGLHAHFIVGDYMRCGLIDTAWVTASSALSSLATWGRPGRIGESR